MALSRKTKIMLGLGGLSLLALSFLLGTFASGTDAPKVTVVKVKKHPVLRSTVTAPGEIRPVQYINLTSEVQGRIEEIYVKEGDIVHKGQQLVRLDPNQLQSSADAQLAAYKASLDDVRSSRSQVIAAQNQLLQARQGLVVFEAAVSTARENVNQALQKAVTTQTDVDKSDIELKAAKRELKRTEDLLESDVVSRLEHDKAKDRVDSAIVSLNNAEARLKSQNIAAKEAIARVKEAEARVKQQNVAIQDAKRAVITANYRANASDQRARQQAAVLRGSRNQRDKALQLAPIAGIIAEIPSKVGTFATANLSSTPLLTIADMSIINVEVKVDETEIDEVAVGQFARVKVDALGDKEIEGKVIQKSPLAVGKSQTSGGLSATINVQEAKEFRVVIELKRDIADYISENLRPGMSATAKITTAVKKDVIAIPIQAIVEKRAESEENEKTDNASTNEKKKLITGVYILDGKNARFLEITTGIMGESDIQITSGLDEMREVITGPSRVLNKLKDGDAVVKRKEKDR